MATGKSLWGNIPSKRTSSMVSPFAILEEQGEQLARATGGQLSGRTVRGGQYGDEFVLDFYIYAASLGQYAYPLLKVIHGIGMYPLRLREHGEHEEILCKDDQDFEKALQSILSSPRVHKVVQALLEQMPD